MKNITFYSDFKLSGKLFITLLLSVMVLSGGIIPTAAGNDLLWPLQNGDQPSETAAFEEVHLSDTAVLNETQPGEDGTIGKAQQGEDQDELRGENGFADGQAGSLRSYALEPNQVGMHQEGHVYTTTICKDETDIYIPKSGDDKLPVVILLQGAKVDKSHYSNYAKILSSYGFIVVVPNHRSLLGKNMTDQGTFNRAWEYVRAQNFNDQSPLVGRVDLTQVAVAGHSFGGLAGLGVLQGKGQPPTHLGLSYKAPPELAAGVFYGTNTKIPVVGHFSKVDTRGIPTAFIQGSRDEKALPEDTFKQFTRKTTGGPGAMIMVEGANHYGITDSNNPAGAARDNNTPSLQQDEATETIARWTGMFLRSHLYDDIVAEDYVYHGTGSASGGNADVVAVK